MSAEVVEAIRSGEPVILPTDTVYGLCASPHTAESAGRAYRLKGRGGGHPSALLAADLDVLLDAIPELRGRSATIARALLPGPYTLVLPNPARRFPWLTGSRPETIGLRVPEVHGDVKRVLDEVGAVLATSANRPGGPDPRRLDDVPAELRAGCAAELDAGELPGVPSTVLDLTGADPRVLREGAVTATEALARVAAAVG
jgi:L-threonylcarbamoyladenylate synthase